MVSKNKHFDINMPQTKPEIECQVCYPDTVAALLNL
jgi:hypothetical protein